MTQLALRAFVSTALSLLFALILPLLAQAKEAPHGLAWNRTGLPAVFPLQVMTREGQDYFLTLLDAETDQPAVGAHIDGGRFFKLLVPPGTYRLRFDALRADAPPSESFSLRDPLTFEIRGTRKKSGHLVDISGIGLLEARAAEIRPQVICQVLEQDFEPRFPLVTFDAAGMPLPYQPRDWANYPSLNTRSYFCD
ncbi:hypothetical protein R3X27_15365 [Tropicimonas sp. TH_r6]|uniref:hypothetical protein n=1 Tax=Tropicimonas sp. TH_r6 TaxID=3082085 RepID=UPI00295466E0|nr:hypothetical protein [Tropicimonas sp. TH_r6]MDV7144067.1 hypothetical protein [Tropicimonas sp. TH_r6]